MPVQNRGRKQILVKLNKYFSLHNSTITKECNQNITIFLQYKIQLITFMAYFIQPSWFIFIKGVNNFEETIPLPLTFPHQQLFQFQGCWNHRWQQMEGTQNVVLFSQKTPPHYGIYLTMVLFIAVTEVPRHYTQFSA